MGRPGSHQILSEVRRGVRLPAETRRGASRPVPIDLPHPPAALACSLQPSCALAGAWITQSRGSLFLLLAFTAWCRLSYPEPVAVQHPGQEPPHRHLPPVPASPAASHPALSEQGASPVAALVRLLSSALHPTRVVGSWLN